MGSLSITEERKNWTQRTRRSGSRTLIFGFTKRSSLHIHHIYFLRHLRFSFWNGHQTGSCAFLQCGYQLNSSLLVPLHLTQLHPMGLCALLIGLESFMLQMLRQKLEHIQIVKIGIALTLLPHPCPEPNFPIFQGYGPRSTGKLVPDAASRLLLYLVKGSHP